MADDTFPMPTEIKWDSRQAGTLVYLCKKTISASDTTDGLGLIGNYFRNSLTYSMLDRLKSDDGVKVMVFTPAGAFIGVTMKHKVEDNQFYVQLSKAATLEILEKNGYVIGDEICCWCKYQPRPPFHPPGHGTEEKLSILIQKVSPTDDQPGGVEFEAADKPVIKNEN